MEDLLAAWAHLITPQTPDPGAVDVGRRLLAAWSEPHRTYHSLSHLRDILSRVDELGAHAEDIDAVRLAAWYHDAVYQGRPDDEECSALLAQRDLSAIGMAPSMVDEVGRLVRLTVRHDPAVGDRNGEVLCDADLAALAVPAERYRQNSADIRAEYAHISDDAFRTGRTRVLLALLQGPVYRTEDGRRRWEDAARTNLQAELAALGG